MSKTKLRKSMTIACACYVALCFVLIGAFAASTGVLVVKNQIAAPGSLATGDVLDAILAVFTAVGTWISTNVPTFFTMFYVAETGLTFLGVLAVAGLSFSVVFLLIGIIQKFLHFAG